jgi:AcrR family transcriptional regulator
MARTRDAGMEDRILDSAFAVFGERGYQTTTLKEIAQGAGISTGSVYTYFPDKESLFIAAVNRGWAIFIEELEAISRGRLHRDERVAVFLDRSFSTLSAALPLIKGMLFEASKQNLVKPNVDRLCLAIGELLKPDEDSPLREAWESGATQRLLLTRILILGVLSSAALVPTASPATAIEGLKEAIRALMTATGVFIGDGGKPSSTGGAAT